MTALHVAAQKGKADVVRYLLAKGAKTDLLDSTGRKPIDLADTGTARTGAAAAATSSNVGSSTPVAAEAGASGVAEVRALLQNAIPRR